MKAAERCPAHFATSRSEAPAATAPERDRIRVELPEAERKLAELKGQRDAAANFHHDHPKPSAC